MAYSSKNSCKKGCSCDSCKGSHKSIQSENFKEKAANLIKKTKEAGEKIKTAATLGLGDTHGQEWTTTSNLSGTFPGAGTAAAAAFNVGKRVVDAFREASDPYYGTAQHLQDLKDTKQEHLWNADQASKDKNYEGAQRHRQMAHEVDQRIKQHPLYKIEEGFIKKLKSLNKKTKTAVDRYRETQKRLSQKPPSAARAKAMRKAFDVLDSKGKGHMAETSKEREDMLNESKFAVGDTLQNNTRQTMQGVEPGVPHKVVKVKKQYTPFGDLVTYHLKNTNTGKVVEFRNAHVLLKKLDEELKTVDDVTKTLPRGVEKKGPGEAYGNVDKCAPVSKDKDKTVVAGKTGEEYSKKPQEEVKQMSEDKYVKLAEAAFGSLNKSNPFRSAPLNEEAKVHPHIRALVKEINKHFDKIGIGGKTTYDGVTNGVHVIKHDAPEDKFGDIDEHHFAVKGLGTEDVRAVHIGGHKDIDGDLESLDRQPEHNVRLNLKKKDNDSKVSKAAQQGAMEEEVEHLNEISLKKASDTLTALNQMGHDKQDPATTRFVRQDLKAFPSRSGEDNVTRSLDNMARHIERKHGRAAAAAAAHAAIHADNSYGGAWTSKKFRDLAAEHEPEKMEEDIASFKAGYSPKQVTTNKGFVTQALKGAGEALKGAASSAVKAAGDAALKAGRAGVNVVGRKIADTVRAGMNEPSKLGKVEENNINQRFPDVERDVAAIMKESYKKKKMMEDATNIQIATPEQRNDWLDVGRGSMDIADYINKYKV